MGDLRCRTGSSWLHCNLLYPILFQGNGWRHRANKSEAFLFLWPNFVCAIWFSSVLNPVPSVLNLSTSFCRTLIPFPFSPVLKPSFQFSLILNQPFLSNTHPIRHVPPTQPFYSSLSITQPFILVSPWQASITQPFHILSRSHSRPPPPVLSSIQLRQTHRSRRRPRSEMC